MKKILWAFILFFLLPPPVFSQKNIQTEIKTPTKIRIENQTTNIPSSGYIIKNFDSEILVNQDTSLEVSEKIKVFFYQPKHGIFRIIPIIYSTPIKTIKAGFKVISLTDEKGNPYPYEKSRFGQSIQLKIGDPNKTLTGEQTYVIKYQITKVLLSYKDHEEIYWNVTGHEWDTTIEKATAIVNSPYAPLTQAICFAGTFGSQEKNCQLNFEKNKAFFETTTPLGAGRDFTIVVSLNKANQLHFPGPLEKIFIFFIDNWGYLVALLPFLIMFYFWYTKGRDIRWVSENIYYTLQDQKTKVVPLFAREHLPMVYSPIKGLTPAQVGTIIDEKVDIQDVVAEIVELVRLGYLEIRKIEKKKFLRNEADYLFVKKEKDPTPLKEYQKFLLENLFKKSKSPDQVTLSELKKKFYIHLKTFKNKLYKNMVEEKLFFENPQNTRIKWFIIAIFLLGGAGFLDFLFMGSTLNAAPFFLVGILAIPTFLLALRMPRRTPQGYAFFRQIVGLRWYLDKGKWREEIAEKNLFFEEILPLTICLGLVNKLTKEMAALGIQPPSYFVGVNASTFSSDFNHFYRQTSSTFLSSPGGSWSGRSSWSGGSGFSGGGFSGGGFGGGGGGSW